MTRARSCCSRETHWQSLIDPGIGYTSSHAMVIISGLNDYHPLSFFKLSCSVIRRATYMLCHQIGREAKLPTRATPFQCGDFDQEAQ